ncbi:MAG: dihydroneopterin aldolase [Chitinophagaceae bacterium]|nr:MAG: dihydroneopterin aldolase [Chitinophagaceae bacterium]
MKGRFTIELEGLRFFAPHGLYAGEARTGNEFEVALQLGIAEPEGALSLADSINYVAVHELVHTVFGEREELLERLCQKIAGALQKSYPQLLDLHIRIRKLTPAIARFSGSVGVSYSKVFTPPL